MLLGIVGTEIPCREHTGEQARAGVCAPGPGVGGSSGCSTAVNDGQRGAGVYPSAREGT